jgi:septal ring factor EnvC (AmiA/AmiB activator)
MGWLADLLQIITSSDTLWKAVALVLLGYFAVQMHNGLKNVLEQLEQTSKALAKNGKPISVSGELTGLEETVKKDIEQVEQVLVETREVQENCFMNQQECMRLQREFRDKPYQMCEKFANCPAVISKIQLVESVKEMIKDQFRKDLEATQATQRKIEEALVKAEEDRKRIEDKIDRSNEVIAAFTKDFGSEVVRAVIRNLSINKGKTDGRE